jgi:hypothetical protein
LTATIRYFRLIGWAREGALLFGFREDFAATTGSKLSSRVSADVRELEEGLRSAAGDAAFEAGRAAGGVLDSAAIAGQVLRLLR